MWSKKISILVCHSLPSGNLSSVIKNADQLSLVGLTRQVNNLANAENSKLKPEDTRAHSR
jgi:2-oxoglutarate dehydrogenase E2 component (dihydrolipoamide succinyltransferase)